MYLPDEDKMYSSKKEMLDRIVVLLGGRVAESIMLDDISTGASSDLQRATDIARKMVTQYGMSSLGAVSYDEGGEVFIGRDYGHSKSYSEKVAAEIDEEIRKIIETQYKKTETLLRENINFLEAVAQKLIEKETIDNNEFEECLSGLTDGEVVSSDKENL